VALNQQENMRFSMEWEMRFINWVQFLFVHKIIMSEVKRVEFINDRISYITLKRSLV
jgi:hypothetical protein